MKPIRIPEQITITEASRFTGMDFKTIKKRIGNLPVVYTEGRNNFYDCLDLLKNVFLKATDDEKSDRNLTKERADYYYELKLKTRLEREKLAEKYVDAEAFNINQTKRFLAFKEKLLNVSAKLGPKVAKKDPVTATQLMNEAIKEALSELVEEEIERLKLQQDNIEKNNKPANETDDDLETSN